MKTGADRWRVEMRNVTRARGRGQLALGMVPKDASEKEQILVHLRYERGLSWYEIADWFGLNYATVRRWHDQLLDRIADG